MKLGLIEYRLIDEYGHYMFISAATFLALSQVVRFLMTSFYTVTPKQTKVTTKEEHDELIFEISNRIVSLAHALLVCAMAVYNLMVDSPIQQDKMFGFSPGATITLMFTCGYFLSDTIEIVRFCFRRRILFLIHHIASFFTLSLGAIPINQYWAMWFLLFELSTPFMILRWMMIKRGYTKTWTFHAAEIAFAISFFGIRIFGGVWSSYMFVSSMIDLIQCDAPDPVRYPLYKPEYGIPRVTLIATCISNVIFNLLNLYWGGLIAQKTLSKIVGLKTYDSNIIRNPDGGGLALTAQKKTQ